MTVVCCSWFDSRRDKGRIIRADYTRLPPELEPYQAGPLHMSAPPTKGTWRAGQRVLAHPLVSADGFG